MLNLKKNPKIVLILLLDDYCFDITMENILKFINQISKSIKKIVKKIDVKKWEIFQ